MPKNLLQDMVKIKHTSAPKALLEEVPFKSVFIGKNPANKTRHTLWGVAIISLLFFLFSISYLLSQATVVVNPKIQNVVLNESLSASKDSGTDDLSFDFMSFPGGESKIVQATGKKDVSEKAKGIVVIYDDFGYSSQKLSIDTRLLGSNGKIYKTENAITVPGIKGSTPGSIEVGIYGATPGEEYNSDPLDFTILGFKGTPKYSKFYGRSKGPITGGYVGKVSVISDADKASALAQLNSSLKAKLLANAVNQIPTGFVLFNDAVFLSTKDPVIPLVADQYNNLTITLTGTLYGFLFNEEKLTEKIAKDSIDGYDDSPVYLPNIQDLVFSLTSPASTDNLSFNDVNNINFNLSGAAKIVWKVDEGKLLADLLGKSKKDFSQILLQYPNIDSANLSISPFWRMSLPDKMKDVKVIVNYPK